MLVLLYADQRGDLRVVLTIRAKTLSSCKSYMCFFCACLLCFVLWNHFFYCLGGSAVATSRGFLDT